jgi:hypothetical protein
MRRIAALFALSVLAAGALAVVPADSIGDLLGGLLLL